MSIICQPLAKVLRLWTVRKEPSLMSWKKIRQPSGIIWQGECQGAVSQTYPLRGEKLEFRARTVWLSLRSQKGLRVWVIGGVLA